MKTFRSKPNFIAKPPARVQAMAKKYGILEITNKGESYGANLLKEGYGIFETHGTEEWKTNGANTITNPDNTLLATYVDSANGAYVYLRDDTHGLYSGDLVSDLVDATTYRIRLNLKTAAGTVTLVFLNFTDGSPFISFNNTDFEIIEMIITRNAASGSPYMRFQNLTTGENVTVDWYTVQEIL